MRGAAVLDALRGRAGRLADRFRSRAVVLLYHRVTVVESDPQLLSASPDNFDTQLQVLRATCQVLPFAELIQLAQAGKMPERAVAITFDDGYADNLHEAKPLLEKHGAPATVFVSSGYIGTDREYWWDEVERLLLLSAGLPPSLELPQRGAWPTRSEVERRRAYDDVLELMKTRTPEDMDRVLRELRAWAGEPERGDQRATHRPLRRDELERLAHGDLVAIGAHTRGHPRLQPQPPEVQREEIEGSRRDLAELLGAPVELFSYPFGGPRLDWDATTRRTVQEAGFRAAASTYRATMTKASDPFALPRFLVRDWDGGEFERRLDRFFSGRE
jgi:peptidoglycan/xylan/chitin deacetylase (PgdA/CDA1 family)